ERLTERARFPTEGLARFADHPDPAVRRLVALDPFANPELIEQLTTDPDPTVRRAMASSRRLPVPLIAALLSDPELAEAAAGEPGPDGRPDAADPGRDRHGLNSSPVYGIMARRRVGGERATTLRTPDDRAHRTRQPRPGRAHPVRARPARDRPAGP